MPASASKLPARSILPLLAVVARLGAAQAPAAPATAPRIDGQRALRTVAEFIAISPRDSGTANAAAAADWLAERCRQLGAETLVDRWQEDTDFGPKTFANVVAVLPGQSPKRVLVGSHYDTKVMPDVPNFQGANDSGSSTGVLLEMLQTFQEQAIVPPYTLEFVFFDGEEAVQTYTPGDGLHGSRRHARQIRDRQAVDHYLAMVLLDMIGDRDLKVTFPSDTPTALAKLAFAAAAELGVGRHFGYFKGGRIIDDHVPFMEIGMPAINFIDFEYGPNNAFWHTAEDTLDKLSARSLEIVGNVALRLIWGL